MGFSLPLMDKVLLLFKNYKSIEDYKPTGNLIYNSKSLEFLNKKKDKLFN